ncbi:MAG: hypothetical protein ABIR37_03320 [Candidatus Saccharimonadales bacterium]
MTYPELSLLPETKTATDFVREFEEPMGLDYLHSPLEVRSSTHPEGVRYDLLIDHAPLDAGDLHAFTHGVAPYPGFDSVYGIVADWNVVDRAEDGSPYAQRLVNLHTHLGKAWDEFSRSRPAFLRVMQDGMDFSASMHFDASPSNEYFKRAEDIVTHRLVTDAAEALGGEHTLLEEVLRTTGVENPQAVVLDAMSQVLNRTRNARRQLQNPQRIIDSFKNRPASSRARLVELMTVGWSKEYRQVFDDVVRNAAYHQIKMEDGATYYVRRATVDCDPLEQVAQAKVERSDRFEAKIAELKLSSKEHYFHRPQERKTKVVVPGSVKVVQPPSTIEPQLAWVKKNDGTRQFLIGREHTQDETGAFHFKDGVLGVLLAAYFAPEVRSEWPTHMGVKGSRLEQGLGAAQVPVLALFPHVQKRLLGSEFIENAEKLAGKR